MLLFLETGNLKVLNNKVRNRSTVKGNDNSTSVMSSSTDDSDKISDDVNDVPEPILEAFTHSTSDGSDASEIDKVKRGHGILVLGSPHTKRF